MITTASPASLPPPFPTRRYTPAVSSPLASSLKSSSSSDNIAMKPRATLFPTSRPLRPFASISANLQPTQSFGGKSEKKSVKLIEPPAGFKANFFVLNLTQAEFSRRD